MPSEPNTFTDSLRYPPITSLSYTGDSLRYPGLPIALDGMGIRHLQEHVDRPVGIPCFQWVQCLEGTGSLWIEDSVYKVEPGNGFFIPLNTPHIYFAETNPWIVNYLCFNGELVSEILEVLSIRESGVYQLSHPDRIILAEEQIFTLAQNPSQANSMEISKLIYGILVDLSMDMKETNSIQLPGKNELVHTIISYLHEHTQEPFSLTDVAAYCKRSKEYLCQLFKQSTGYTILAYQNQIRMAQAKFLLLEPSRIPVNQVARLCGFESASYFCAVFRKETGMTPDAFRSSPDQSLPNL